MVLSGAVFYGTATSVAKHMLSSSGVLGTASTTNTTNGPAAVPYLDVMTDGTNVIAWRIYSAGGTSYGLVSLAPAYTWPGSFTWRSAITPSAAPVMTLDTLLLVPLAGGAIDTVNPADGTATQLATLANSGRSPLVGWDGVLAHQHFYFTRNKNVLYGYTAAGQLSWTAAPNGNAYRAVTMDCAGRLFGATNDLTGGQSLVYALVTDDKGLADTVWPSYRGDARNTGNAAALKYGIRTATSCTQ
jgi:hypothetical protein